MKKVLVGGGVVIAVIAVVVAALYLLSNLNALVAKAVEKHGSKVTETNVRVSGVDISIREGRGSIQELRIASPEGFRARDALSFGDIVVDIDIKSVRKEPVVIDEIRIQSPVVNAELTKTGASNIDELRKRVQAYSARKAGARGESTGKSKRIRIKQFTVEKGQVVVDASALGLEERTVALPEIRLTDVGGAGGAPPDEIAKIILSAVAKKATSQIAGSELDRLIKGKLRDSVTDKGKGLLDKIGD